MNHTASAPLTNAATSTDAANPGATDGANPGVTNAVLRVPAAAPAAAAAYFGASLAFHADVSDVASALAADGDPGFVVLDSRSTASWDQGHVPGAVHLPTALIPAQAEQILRGELPRDGFRPLLYPLLVAGAAKLGIPPFAAAPTCSRTCHRSWRSRRSGASPA